MPHTAIVTRLRPATPWDIPAHISWDWAMVATENEKVMGYVCMGIFDGCLWAHELNYWGNDPTVAARLFKALRKAARDMGFKEVRVTTYNEKLEKILLKNGFEITHRVLKGTL